MIAELFKYNCSTLFILKPVVGINFGLLSSEYGMINSYLKDKSREDLEGNYLFVLFRPEDFSYFEMFIEDQVETNPSFMEDYDHPEGYVVMVYKIRDELKDDFELFKQGKYSKLSYLIKDCYQKEVKAFLKPIPSFQWQVFKKNKELREKLEEFVGAHIEKDMELWALPDVEGKEVLDIEKFLQPEPQKLLKNKL